MNSTVAKINCSRCVESEAVDDDDDDNAKYDGVDDGVDDDERLCTNRKRFAVSAKRNKTGRGSMQASDA